MGSALTQSDWISIVGTVVSIVGFGIAITQLRRVARAVHDQQKRFAGAMLQSRASDLERIEQELTNTTSRQDAQRAVREWRRHAADLQALLDATGDDGGRVAGALRWLRSSGRWWRRGAHEPEPDFATRNRNDLNDAIELSLGILEITLSEVADTNLELDQAREPLLREISAACRASRALSTGMMIQTTA